MAGTVRVVPVWSCGRWVRERVGEGGWVVRCGSGVEARRLGVEVRVLREGVRWRGREVRVGRGGRRLVCVGFGAGVVPGRGERWEEVWVLVGGRGLAGTVGGRVARVEGWEWEPGPEGGVWEAVGWRGWRERGEVVRALGEGVCREWRWGEVEEAVDTLLLLGYLVRRRWAEGVVGRVLGMEALVPARDGRSFRERVCGFITPSGRWSGPLLE
ncbi:hypothetical protein [Spirochaeta thermophila]|uniref:Uncharacterized protein n=1 Tax=Winmispira thermophila (strain ATCC 49972 / DSM 6192 / RI 19.B1) TaxID=665571 RepID=E0RQ29_WINT6|nr:hypothetical protein [Spirochaeta thermophila]ADN02882.1 hypothetical protein STHERM_c19470 [Spirochaeta thermophila DSM 6192]